MIFSILMSSSLHSNLLVFFDFVVDFHARRPHSSLWFCKCVFKCCFMSWWFWWGGMEKIVIFWQFMILQSHPFSLIRFLSLEFQFHFAMPLFYCFCFTLLRHLISIDVFLPVLWLRPTFNVEILTQLFVSFSQRICLLRLWLVFTFNTAANYGFECSFVFFSSWKIFPSFSEKDWLLCLNFR